MNSLTRIMSYDKTKIKNQENCNCKECVSTENAELENQTIEYPKLSEEEIEQIINEKYSDKDEKTKTFIRKALRKHGDRYDYSNVKYINNHSKVIIICSKHGEFSQIPSNHLQYKGCSECGGNKKLTTKEFIIKANEVHKFAKYDYSKVKYINATTKITIICLNHDKPYEFSQLPHDHLNGIGCPKCKSEKLAELNKLTIEEFIEKANKIHGLGTYDYSKVNYINNHTDVIIICSIHGEFLQNPSNHLQGKGCPLCSWKKLSESRALTFEEFIEKANKIHKDEIYDYSKVKYVNAQTKVMIICLNHNEPDELLQTPVNHLRGGGCPLCGIKKRAEHRKLTINKFIERANKIHGVGKYDYSESSYIDIKTPIKIICSKEGHGAFFQTPDNHLQGKRCPHCVETLGETKVRIFLTNNNIKFEREKHFDDCRNKLPLPFDFYLPQYNLCIEFDGEGHFKKINWSGRMTEEQMEENLKLNQFRDQIKNDYCKEKGINLIKINYIDKN